MTPPDDVIDDEWAPKAPSAPPHWCCIDFSEAFDSVAPPDSRLPESKYKSDGAFAVIDQGAKFISGYTDEGARLINQQGSVVVFGDHTRRFKLVNFPFVPGADGTKILRPRAALDAKFCYYACLSLKLPNRGYSRHFSMLRRCKFPIAPLAEQCRIVAKIEELFSELDKAVESLTTAREQLKAYRQSVLKYAFGQDSGQTSNDPAVHTQVITVGNAARKIVDCPHSTARFRSTGFYCIDSTWVEDNRILLEEARFVDEQTYQQRVQRLKPEKGDVLLVREGSKKIGTALVLTLDDEVCLGQRMMMMRLNPEIDPQYFVYYIQSEGFKRQYRPLIGGSASPHLNIADIKRMTVPLFSKDKQNAIVRLIDANLSVADEIEATIRMELQKAESLRQSILVQAFSGQLVPQDPNDEPASVLLERIRADKEKLTIREPKKRGKGAAA